MDEPTFVKVAFSEERPGAIVATTNRGDVYELRLSWESVPEIRLLKRGPGYVEPLPGGS